MNSPSSEHRKGRFRGWPQWSRGGGAAVASRSSIINGSEWLVGRIIKGWSVWRMIGGSRLFLSCGRLAARAALVELSSASSSSPRSFCTTSASSSEQTASSSTSPPRQVTARCAGFPKDLVGGVSKVRERGVFGDDACFVARFKHTVLVAGVADGVGGWRKYGVDPSAVSRRLMSECEKRVKSGRFDPQRPDKLLSAAFDATKAPPKPAGSSTACVVVLAGDSLYSANLGDSGFLVVRGGRIFARSAEQTHYFNAPFQLTFPPEGFEGFIGDSPTSAERQELQLAAGDVVVLATDGLWDNLPEEILLRQLEPLVAGEADVQEVCNSLALTARRLAFDSSHQSPFALKAQAHGIEAPGGKPDDITLVLILVS